MRVAYIAVALAVYPLRGVYGHFRLAAPEKWFFRLAAKRCRQRGVELVYTRTFECPRYTLAQNLPTLVETHSVPETNPASRQLFAQIAHPSCLGLATITPQLAERYQALGVPAEKIVVAPDGVDLAAFAHPLDKAEARRRLGLDPARRGLPAGGRPPPGRGPLARTRPSRRPGQLHPHRLCQQRPGAPPPLGRRRPAHALRHLLPHRRLDEPA